MKTRKPVSGMGVELLNVFSVQCYCHRELMKYVSSDKARSVSVKFCGFIEIILV